MHTTHNNATNDSSAADAPRPPSAASGGRRPVNRGPSGLRGSLAADSISESIATMTTGTCSSANASPRRGNTEDAAALEARAARAGSGSVAGVGPPGVAAVVAAAVAAGGAAGAAAAAASSGAAAGAGAGAAGSGAALNIRALAGVAVSGEPNDSVLGWRARAAGGGGTGSFSMDGASDAGASSTTAAPGEPHHRSARAGADARRNMSLQQLQKAIKSIMLTDHEMYAKLQAGLQGIGSLARETHQLTVNRDVTGATCINQYVVVKTLGRGSYGKVKLCLNTLDGRLYAVKMMNRSFLLRMLRRPKAALRKSSRTSLSLDPSAAAAAAANAANGAAGAASSAAAAPGAGAPGAGAAPLAPPRPPETLDEVSKEIAILKKLDHPNVVRLFEVIDPPGSQYMMLVMEYLERGPVLQTRDQAGFGRLPEEVAADYFRQAVRGLDYLHYHRVVHGDIKPGAPGAFFWRAVAWRAAWRCMGGWRLFGCVAADVGSPLLGCCSLLGCLPLNALKSITQKYNQTKPNKPNQQNKQTNNKQRTCSCRRAASSRSPTSAARASPTPRRRSSASAARRRSPRPSSSRARGRTRLPPTSGRWARASTASCTGSCRSRCGWKREAGRGGGGGGQEGRALSTARQFNTAPSLAPR